MEKGLSPAFRDSIRGAANPYGSGDTAACICDILAATSFPLPRQKGFRDLG
jgi:hypothetical protein